MKKIILRYFLIILCYLSWSPFLLYHENNLESDGNWNSEKLKMDKLMGAQAFVANPQALAFRALNLGEVFGFNRVITKRSYRNPEKAEFQLRFSEHSYLYFLFNFSENNFFALRFAPSDSEVSLHKVSREGEFLSTQNVSILNQISVDERHRLQVYFKNTRVGVSVNSEEIRWFNVNLNEVQRIGFQGGFHPVFVDSVKLKDHMGRVLFKDTFDSAYSLSNIPLIPLVLILSILLIELSLFPIFHFSSFFTNTINILAISILLSGIIASGWYLPILASKHIYFNYHEIFNVDEHKKRRKKFVISNFDKKLSLNKKNSRKILFVGSSQTEGSGAYSLNENFVSLVERFLNSSDNTPEYQCYSLGISAYTLREILDEYETLLSRFVPEASFLNISHNDEVYGSLDDYSEQLERFLLLNKRYGVTSIFIKEAVSTEFAPAGLRAHEIIDEVSKSHNIPVIDVHSFMKEKDRSGFIWWDQVHPTSYGHRLIAEKIYKFMDEQEF